MSIDTRYDAELNVIVRTVTETVSAEEVKQSLDGGLRHSDFKRGMNALWNLGDVDLSHIGAADLQDIIKYLESTLNQRGSEYKLAIIAPLDMSFGVSRMFELYARDVPVVIKVFRGEDEAYQWIAVNEQQDAV